MIKGEILKRRFFSKLFLVTFLYIGDAWVCPPFSKVNALTFTKSRLEECNKEFQKKILRFLQIWVQIEHFWTLSMNFKNVNIKSFKFQKFSYNLFLIKVSVVDLRVANRSFAPFGSFKERDHPLEFHIVIHESLRKRAPLSSSFQENKIRGWCSKCQLYLHERSNAH